MRLVGPSGLIRIGSLTTVTSSLSFLSVCRGRHPCTEQHEQVAQPKGLAVATLTWRNPGRAGTVPLRVRETPSESEARITECHHFMSGVGCDRARRGRRRERVDSSPRTACSDSRRAPPRGTPVSRGTGSPRRAMPASQCCRCPPASRSGAPGAVRRPAQRAGPGSGPGDRSIDDGPDASSTVQQTPEASRVPVEVPRISLPPVFVVM